MTIRDLLQDLAAFDMDTEIMVQDTDGEYRPCKVKGIKFEDGNKPVFNGKIAELIFEF